MLAVTCDNTSNNDAMVDKLKYLVPSFSSTASHTHCFLHIINLVAKFLISQFDMNKKDADTALNDIADQ